MHEVANWIIDETKAREAATRENEIKHYGEEQAAVLESLGRPTAAGVTLPPKDLIPMAFHAAWERMNAENHYPSYDARAGLVRNEALQKHLERMAADATSLRRVPHPDDFVPFSENEPGHDPSPPDISALPRSPRFTTDPTGRELTLPGVSVKQDRLAQMPKLSFGPPELTNYRPLGVRDTEVPPSGSKVTGKLDAHESPVSSDFAKTAEHGEPYRSEEPHTVVPGSGPTPQFNGHRQLLQDAVDRASEPAEPQAPPRYERASVPAAANAGTLEPSQHISPQHLLQLKQTWNDAAEWGRPSTKENAPYRLLIGALNEDIGNLDPRLKALNARYGDTMEGIKGANDILFGKKQAQPTERAASDRAAANKVARHADAQFQDEPSRAALSHQEQMDKAGARHPDLALIARQKAAQEALRYGGSQATTSLGGEGRRVGRRVAGQVIGGILGSAAGHLGAAAGAKAGAGIAENVNPLRARVVLPIAESTARNVTGAKAGAVAHQFTNWTPEQLAAIKDAQRIQNEIRASQIGGQ
jgi:hypothetical protein